MMVSQRSTAAASLMSSRMMNGRSGTPYRSSVETGISLSDMSASQPLVSQPTAATGGRALHSMMAQLSYLRRLDAPPLGPPPSPQLVAGMTQGGGGSASTSASGAAPLLLPAFLPPPVPFTAYAPYSPRLPPVSPTVQSPTSTSSPSSPLARQSAVDSMWARGREAPGLSSDDDNCASSFDSDDDRLSPAGHPGSMSRSLPAEGGWRGRLQQKRRFTRGESASPADYTLWGGGGERPAMAALPSALRSSLRVRSSSETSSLTLNGAGRLVRGASVPVDPRSLRHVHFDPVAYSMSLSRSASAEGGPRSRPSRSLAAAVGATAAGLNLQGARVSSPLCSPPSRHASTPAHGAHRSHQHFPAHARELIAALRA